MCDQSEVSYLPGQVVWVKLGPVWWPGLVASNEDVPHEITKNLRKTPIAIVKFFQEDQFEYVHKLSNIYHYNCLKKKDYIKKGLDMYRSKNRDAPSNMKLFPEDVARAELLTGGDPQIIHDEVFQPEEKPTYSDLFASNKKIPKKVKPETIKKRTPQPTQPAAPRIITHPRFLDLAISPGGVGTNYEARERKQEPYRAECDEEDTTPTTYRCPDCEFTTIRLNVIVLHNKSHTRNYAPSPAPKKAIKRKHPVSTPPVAAVRHKEQTPNPWNQNINTTASPRSPVRPPKMPKTNGTLGKSPRKPGRPRKVVEDKTPPISPTKSSAGEKSSSDAAAAAAAAATSTNSQPARSQPQKDEFQESLLEDWAEYETADQEAAENDVKAGEGSKETSSGKDKTDREIQTKEKKGSGSSKKSCFDFDDSEDHLVIDKSKIKFGRKIPRVLGDKSDEAKDDLPVNVDTRVVAVKEDEVATTNEDSTAQEGHLEEMSVDNEVEIASEDITIEQNSSPPIKEEDATPELDEISVPSKLPEIPRSLKKEHIKMYNASLAQQAELSNEESIPTEESVPPTIQTAEPAVAHHSNEIKVEEVEICLPSAPEKPTEPEIPVPVECPIEEPSIVAPEIQNEVEIEIQEEIQSTVPCEPEPYVPIQNNNVSIDDIQIPEPPLPQVVDKKVSKSTPVLIVNKASKIGPNRLTIEDIPKGSNTNRRVMRLTTMPKLETISPSQLTKVNSVQLSKAAAHTVRLVQSTTASSAAKNQPRVVQSLLNMVNAAASPGQQTPTSSGKIPRMVLLQTSPKVPGAPQPRLITSSGLANVRRTAASSPTVRIASATTLQRSPKGPTASIVVGKSPAKPVFLSPDAFQKLMQSQSTKPTIVTTPKAVSAVAAAATESETLTAPQTPSQVVYVTGANSDTSKLELNYIVDAAGNLIAENTVKKEDILAKALQDMDVLQTEMSLPCPSNVTQSNNKSATSIYESVTLNTPPIMSAYETPSRAAISEIPDDMIIISDEIATTTAEYNM